MGYTEPRSGRSPLFYIGMGCLVLFGLGFVGCVALGVAGFNVFKGVAESANKPIPQEQVIAGLKDIPRYPNAPMVDVPATRIMRTAILTGVSFAKNAGEIQDVEVGVFGPKDPYEKIRAFYDNKMKALGYSLVKSSEDTEEGSKNWTYRKGGTLATFQYSKITPKKRTADAKDTDQAAPTFEGPILMIMRMDGVKEGSKINGYKMGKGNAGDFATGE